MPVETGSHGKIAMLDRFKNILTTQFPDVYEKEIFLAISGGKDSMTLSHLLLKVGLSHKLLHCNFHLRGNDSELDEQFIRDYAEKHGLKVLVKRFDTNMEAIRLGKSIQETARELRYQWFGTFISDEGSILLTAHHLDDSIETFFINLMRGTGIKGLTGISKKRDNVYRPLSSFTSFEIANFVTNNKVLFRQDESNFDNKYLRNQVRNNLIPQFEDRSPDFKTKVANTIQNLNEINEWILEQVNTFRNDHFKLENTILSVEKDILKNQPPIFIERLFENEGLHRSNRPGFIKFLNADTGARFISHTHTFYIDRNLLLIQKLSNTEKFNTITVHDFPYQITTDAITLTFKLTTESLPFNNESIQQFDLKTINLPLKIRKWQTGDKIRPLGMNGTKLISDILIDKKIPLAKKQNILILEDSNQQIISIIGLVVSNTTRLTPTTKNILVLTSTKKLTTPQLSS